ncbi:MAG: hypothetical protein CM15mP84_10050 [Cellvibrionales bacterium]|nr:MAG: hypothetical protein CM15mP84_10050 [Cellvibrionales bacterium]
MEAGLCLLPPTVSTDMTLTAGVDYLMEGRVTVGNGNGQLETNGDGTLSDGSFGAQRHLDDRSGRKRIR